VEATAIANPGMSVDVTSSETFSLTLINLSDISTTEAVDLQPNYLFDITVTNGLFEDAEYEYSLSGDGFPVGIAYSGECSYPGREGQVIVPPTPGPGSYCTLEDFNDLLVFAAPGTEETFDFTATVHVHAASVPEPPPIGLFAGALGILGWLHRRSRLDHSGKLRL
jgi:hypothetical protein